MMSIPASQVKEIEYADFQSPTRVSDIDSLCLWSEIWLSTIYEFNHSSIFVEIN